MPPEIKGFSVSKLSPKMKAKWCPSRPRLSVDAVPKMLLSPCSVAPLGHNGAISDSGPVGCLAPAF